MITIRIYYVLPYQYWLIVILYLIYNDLFNLLAGNIENGRHVACWYDVDRKKRYNNEVMYTQQSHQEQ